MRRTDFHGWHRRINGIWIWSLKFKPKTTALKIYGAQWQKIGIPGHSGHISLILGVGITVHTIYWSVLFFFNLITSTMMLTLIDSHWFNYVLRWLIPCHLYLGWICNLLCMMSYIICLQSMINSMILLA